MYYIWIEKFLVAGSAGRNLNYKTNKLIPRITGLDPASRFSYCLHSISVQ